jgi:hypothetical protein
MPEQIKNVQEREGTSENTLAPTDNAASPGLSLRKAMRRLKMGHLALRHAIDTGALKATVLPGRTRRLAILEEDIADYLRSRR